MQENLRLLSKKEQASVLFATGFKMTKKSRLRISHDRKGIENKKSRARNGIVVNNAKRRG